MTNKIIENKTVDDLTEKYLKCTFKNCVIELYDPKHNRTEFDSCTFINCEFYIYELEDFKRFFSCSFDKESEKALRQEINRFLDEEIYRLDDNEAIGYSRDGQSSFYLSYDKIQDYMYSEGGYDWGYTTVENELELLIEEIESAIDEENLDDAQHYTNLLITLKDSLSNIEGAINLRSLYVCTREDIFPKDALMTEKDVIIDYCSYHGIDFFFRGDLEALKDKQLDELLEILPKLA